MSPARTNALHAAPVRASFAAAVLLGSAVVAERVHVLDHLSRTLERAAYALADERYGDSIELCEEVLVIDPDSSRARLIAGVAAARKLDSPTALVHLERVPDDGTHEGALGLLHRGMRYAVGRRAREAERDLRAFLERRPGHLLATEQLAWLLAVQGRAWESVPHYATLVRRGRFRADELIMIGAPDRFFVADDEAVTRMLQVVPTDPGPLLARARTEIEENRTDSPLAILARIVAERPELSEAAARYGSLLWATGSEENVLRVLGDSRHPLACIVRGRYRSAHSSEDSAAKEYRRALLEGPCFTEANLLLSRSLLSIGRAEDSRIFAERARRLSTVNYLYSELSTHYDVELVERLVGHLVAMDRHWEAFAWCELVLRRPGDPPDWVHAVHARQRQLALATTGPLVPIPALLEEIELPAGPDATAPAPVREVDVESDPSGGPTFSDAASEVGLRFDYHNGTTAETGLVHMLQATGGGVAALDYDLDGWTDLYFAQACEWPVAGQTEHRNRLFRNVAGRRFEDVTNSTGLGDTGYGQGVAVGDFDNDGDPDVYVCNVGPNRLYRNEGNGTFSDVTSVAGVAGDAWSTSALFADVDGDALPDLYVVNYLKLDEVLARECKHDGRPMGCAPTLFTAEQDRLYLNRGQGRFEDVTDSAGIRVPGGKGLSILGFDADESGRISLFVGNDTTANFFFQNVTTAPGRPQFVETGVAAGVALDEAGLAQATMGIASADADGDGRIDVFVTNFHGESNTFYRGFEGATFADETRRTGLRDPGFGMLGFGTEFLDADLDGWPDLLVANGHVDRTFATGVPDRMPPQLFRNRGRGRFSPVPSETAGGYFAGRYLGRSLAVLDWNRDGRQDACISHIDAPAALLENRTVDCGNHLVIELEGRRTSRDAYGTRVTLSAGDRTWAGQLVAGGGYEVSNERALYFGLGDVEAIGRIRVSWPSGEVDEIESVPTNQRLRIVEGHGRVE